MKIPHSMSIFGKLNVKNQVLKRRLEDSVPSSKYRCLDETTTDAISLKSVCRKDESEAIFACSCSKQVRIQLQIPQLPSEASSKFPVAFKAERREARKYHQPFQSCRWDMSHN